MDEGGCLLIRSTSAVLINGGSVDIAAAEAGHLEPDQPGMAEEQAFLGKSLSSGCAVGLPVIGERGQSRFVILKIFTSSYFPPLSNQKFVQLKILETFIIKNLSYKNLSFFIKLVN